MNNFRLKTVKNLEGEPVGPHTVHMQLTGACLSNGFSEVLKHFEVPILQGRTQPWGDGMEYWFELNDEDARLFSQMLTMAFYGMPPLN